MMPELRIISEDLWSAVKARQALERTRRDQKFGLSKNPLAGAKRPTYLLTELVICGGCGAQYVASGGGRWRCRLNLRKGACTNNRSITTVELEGRVLAGVKRKLLTPELIARFVRMMQKEIAHANREREQGRTFADHKLHDLQARIGKIVRQIEEDDDFPKALMQRLKELEREEEQLREELDATPIPEPIVIPENYAKTYEKAVAGIEQHLTGDDAVQARETIRSLIEKVVIQPSSARQEPLELELHGDLWRMIDFAQTASQPLGKGRQAKNGNGPQLVAGGRMTPLVAGVGFEPTTFRL